MSGSSSDSSIAGAIQRAASRRTGLLAFADIPLTVRAGRMFGRASLPTKGPVSCAHSAMISVRERAADDCACRHFAPARAIRISAAARPAARCLRSVPANNLCRRFHFSIRQCDMSSTNGALLHGVLSAELLHQYAGHPAASSAVQRAVDLQGARGESDAPAKAMRVDLALPAMSQKAKA